MAATAQSSAGNVGGGGSTPARSPSADELSAAMRQVLTGADLQVMTLKMLRKEVVRHLGLGKQAKRELADSRRVEFGSIAKRIIEDMQSQAAAPQPPKPDWLLDMEDEEARSAIYLVTFAAILPETLQNVMIPLKSLEEVTREGIRDVVPDAISNPLSPRIKHMAPSGDIYGGGASLGHLLGIGFRRQIFV